MGCEALWLCNSHAPFAVTASLRFKRRRFSMPKWSCCRIENVQADAVAGVKAVGKRWFHPDRGGVDQFETRNWVGTDTQCPSDSRDRFLVVSFNILGDNNASKHKNLYSHLPSHFMKWDRRMSLICQELSALKPDIVCLQEVDRYDDLKNSLKKEGYASSFKQRTGEAVDGCAMFWKEGMFHLLEGESIEFKGFDLRDNVAQLCVLETTKADPKRLLVGNIHVLFSPNRGDIKLGQDAVSVYGFQTSRELMIFFSYPPCQRVIIKTAPKRVAHVESGIKLVVVRLLLWKAHALSEKWGGVPVVLTGDFNSTPQSAIYEFLASSKLNITTHDRRHLSGQTICQPAASFGMLTQIRKPYIRMNRYLKYCWTDEEVRNASGNSERTKLEHPLKLYSSYASVQGSYRTRGAHGEPLVTTYHEKFLGTVDYIWYSGGLVPTRVLDTLPTDILQKISGLPSKNLGSDHLALASEFNFVEDEKKEEQSASTTSTPRTATPDQTENGGFDRP